MAAPEVAQRSSMARDARRRKQAGAAMGALEAAFELPRPTVYIPPSTRPRSGRPSMAAMQELIGVLTLEQIEVNLFRGRSPKDEVGRIFGGQVIAQALLA